MLPTKHSGRLVRVTLAACAATSLVFLAIELAGWGVTGGSPNVVWLLEIHLVLASITFAVCATGVVSAVLRSPSVPTSLVISLVPFHCFWLWTYGLLRDPFRPRMFIAYLRASTLVYVISFIILLASWRRYATIEQPGVHLQLFEKGRGTAEKSLSCALTGVALCWLLPPIGLAASALGILFAVSALKRGAVANMHSRELTLTGLAIGLAGFIVGSVVLAYRVRAL